MKCSNCGYENAEGNKFCKNCGAKLEIPQTPKFCRNCGKEVTPGHLYCVGCGKPIQESQQTAPVTKTSIPMEEETSTVKEKKKLPIVGIVIAAIIVVALVIAGMWVISGNDTNKGKDDVSKDNPSQMEETQETQSVTQETETIKQETETESEVKNPEETVVLGVLDYQTICMNLMETESAYGSANETMSVNMAQSIVSSNIVAAGSAFCMKDIDETSQERIIFELGYPSARALFGGNMSYSLQDYRQELEGTDYDLSYIAAVYKKDEFKNVVEAFCPYRLIGSATDYDDYVGIMGADGGPWYYFDAYDIKENEKYILIQAACYTGNNGGAENVYEYTIKALFEKTADSVLGMRAVYVEGYENNITQNIASIVASSQLPDYKEKTYRAENLIDGNYGTPWVENVEGVGVGETIQITLNNQMLVQEFVLHNGYQSSEDLLNMNGYVTKISVDFGNGVVKELDCNAYFNGIEKDYLSLNKISLDKPVYTDTIKITILAANAGSKYADTCISEIELH